MVEDESFDLEEIQKQWATESGDDSETAEIVSTQPPQPPVEDPDEIDDWEEVD